MSATLSKEEWKRRLASQGPTQVAEQILGNLIGYRKTSLARAQDVDQLCNAIEALLELKGAIYD